MTSVKRLDINYKTDELFEDFRNFGNKDLYMVDELRGEMIDASSESPFYGIYVGERLGARMALYRKGEVEEEHFPDFDDYLIIWKLEVLKDFQDRGYGTELLNYAKSQELPIKVIARNQSKDFFIKQGFKDLQLKNNEDYDILIWEP
ncbi:N-acetyltransferase [Staphylococcus durrellii]|uniref:N-acetyltransferase n=1 Tax=Staphylococcus durrellii TaxID=2781773 RepID=UPI0018A0CEFE|nr:N-acetyltransferase [Staphylococcus durrellii]MBF7017361.1 N-acetyltransferase [Staphylococcus durrellii]